MDQVLSEFIVETQENLDRIEQELLALEQDPTQLDRIAAIFRAIHTIKGTCGFLELHKLGAVTHAGENLLVTLRDGIQPLSIPIASALLDLVDAVREMLPAIENGGTDGDDDYRLLIQELNRHAQAQPATLLVSSRSPLSRGASRSARSSRKGRKAPLTESPPTSPEGTPPVPREEPPPASSPHESVARPSSPHPANFAPAGQRAANDGGSRSATTIRVDVSVLEQLMTMVGELVLARNQLLELTQNQVRTPLAAACQRINQITTDLQSSVMKTRMQPIGTVWNKFPRVVRELAFQCEKRVRVELRGSETELDKTVLEAISEPLTHIIRNAVDHGVEAPGVRQQQGKSAEGLIVLSAGHAGGHVVIEIGDDGGGINVEKIRRKAVEKGIISDAQAQQMTDADAFNLLFAPGFSTAEKVTNISGRGVGMDVVRSKIERIGGSVDISSELGKGTKIRIRLPLTLAIVPAVIVSSAGHRFAIPQQGLQELLRIDNKRESVEYIQGAPVYRLRGNLLPLARLSDLLGLTDRGEPRGTNHIIVLHSGDSAFGLVVDEVTNSEEIVVKPISTLVAGVNVYAGCTILGDGQVALILEATHLIARARRDAAQTPRTIAEHPRPAADSDAQRGFVLCDVGTSRIAFPLSQVERLEKLDASCIEARSGRAVLQYRGRVIAAIRCETGSDNYFDLKALADDVGRLHALIYRSGEKLVAIIVDRIIDIIEESASPDEEGTLVALGRVTELRNLTTLVTQTLGWTANDDALPIAEVA